MGFRLVDGLEKPVIESPVNCSWKVSVLGYCAESAQQLHDRFARQGPSGLTRLAGQYVVVIQGPHETFIITSAFGTIPYFYTEYNGLLHHGETVLQVSRDSGRPWKWNWRALGDFAQLDYTLECATLHADVQRTPPASVVHFQDGKLTIHRETWDDIIEPCRATAHTALAAFNEEVGRLTDSETALSMSGGLDSRVILSALLKQGQKVPLVVLGGEKAKDVVISRGIAKELQLELTVVDLCTEDYLANGLAIAQLSNGTLSVFHWHAYLYLKKLDCSSISHLLLGTNGEFARSFFLSGGYEAIQAAFKTRTTLLAICGRQLRHLFVEEELEHFSDDLKAELDSSGSLARIEHLCKLCDSSGARGLDKLYLGQRLRNHIALGVRMIADSVSWRAPFLSREWVKQAWGLNRYWKIGSNWHRFAIAQNYPRLLDFPAGAQNRVMPREALRTWISPAWRKRLKLFRVRSRGASGSMAHGEARAETSGHYVQHGQLLGSQDVLEFLCDNAFRIDDLCAPDVVLRIADQQRRHGNRSRAVAWLLTMVYWACVRGVAPTAKRPVAEQTPI